MFKGLLCAEYSLLWMKLQHSSQRLDELNKHDLSQLSTSVLHFSERKMRTHYHRLVKRLITALRSIIHCERTISVVAHTLSRGAQTNLAACRWPGDVRVE